MALNSVLQEVCPDHAVGHLDRAVDFLTTGFYPTQKNRRKRNTFQNDEITLDSLMKKSWSTEALNGSFPHGSLHGL